MNKSDGWLQCRSKYLFMPVFENTGLVTHGLSLKELGNLSLTVGAEETESVLARRQELAGFLGIDHLQIVRGYQVHGDNIHLVQDRDKGRGALEAESAIEDTDGLITDLANIPLAIFVADCVPVFMLDPKKKAIGLVHAGWRGTLAKIAQKAVIKLQEFFGTKPADLLIGLGPAIGPCCYEVGQEIIEKVKQNFTCYEDLIKGKFFNLAAANKQQLLEVGVGEENIFLCQSCTACSSSNFFSYRRGDQGRMMAVLALKSW